MGDDPVYRTAFDVSQRIPAILVMIVALGLLIAIGIGSAVPRSRLATRRRLPILAVAGAALLVLGALLAGMVVGALFLVIWVMVCLALVFVFGNPDVREALGWRREAPGAAAAVFVVISLALASLFGLVGLAAIGLAARLAEGAGEVVAGPITAYRVGDKRDCFDIEGRELCVAEATLSPGFNQQRITGSPLAAGTVVRLTLFGTLIARVEIAEATRP